MANNFKINVLTLIFQIMDGDSLCQDCLQLALQEIDRRNLAVDAHLIPSTDHCICCNISISRRSGRRSRLIPEGRPERVFIAEVIQPRQVCFITMNIVENPCCVTNILIKTVVSI